MEFISYEDYIILSLGNHAGGMRHNV